MAETVARSSGFRVDGGRRDSSDGCRGARGRAAATAAARRGGALTAATRRRWVAPLARVWQASSTMELWSTLHQQADGRSAAAADQQRGRRLAVRQRAIKGIDAREIANEQQRRWRGGLSSGVDGGWRRGSSSERADDVARRRRCSQKGKQKEILY
ncbi:hypothetical protein Scep_023689 [Stephania cephalantha]|uniref:Uncharacterized protein n=1 Tax=Stephania cephalantha TaxID=152367 RepID=A0AAP0HXM6_9MAGN